MLTNSRRRALGRVFTDPALFSRYVLQMQLRDYQVEVARAVVQSVLNGDGRTFAVMMSRQAGKNETSAHIEALLLNLFRLKGGYLVKAAPTFRPQLHNSIRRLRGALRRSWLTDYGQEEGYIVRVGAARALFLSARPGAEVVGATANILLEGDEAQDIEEEKWNKAFRPMGASTNVTTVLWGTAWTSSTMLARAVRALDWLAGKDGVKRVFRVPWQVVAAEVPAYGDYVRAEISRLGAYHPMIRTQYDLAEIDAEGGLFPRATRALMRGNQERQEHPTEGRVYAMLVDVGGASEEQRGVGAGDGKRRDATCATIVEIVRSSSARATYLVVERLIWVGFDQLRLQGTLMTLAEIWGVIKVVVDATGIGAGLAGYLQAELGERAVPFVFSSKSKSDLGWAFLGACNSGRFRDHRDDGSEEQAAFWRQVEACTFEVLEGPGKLMRWGVADRDVHDDALMSAALCARLDEEDLGRPEIGAIIEADDPFDELGGAREDW